MVDPDFAVQRIMAGIAGQEAVTLYSRSTSDTFPAGVAWTARRKTNLTEDQVVRYQDVILGKRARVFQLYKVDQTVFPKAYDRIVDAQGDTNEVKVVDYQLGERVFDCICVEDVS